MKPILFALCDEVDRLRAALRKYGHHGPMCDGLPRGWGGAPLGPCDCGLDAALAPASDQLPVPEQTTAEPDRCPTCESVDQTKCGNPRYPQHDHGAFPLCCPDPWHRAPYDDEGYVAYQDLGEWLGILPAAEPEVGP